ncbi:MAG: HAD family phosphatase [Lachnospiraceae bacterium]|nr:HAD family phosphatase [Lachnospiraceae bacterium]
MPDIKLIALDLDGTLLNSDKVLTPRSRAALQAASEKGIWIVPATGRFYKGMPEVIRSLPFVRYVITINGAAVFDAETGEDIYSADIPTDEAVAFYEYLDTLPVIYDGYMNGWGYMTAEMREKSASFDMLPFQMIMMRDLRSSVPELKAFIKEHHYRPQKMQLFTNDPALRERLLVTMAEKYPQFSVTSSLPNNIEINSFDADKGRAILALAEKLSIPREATMAFGDGLNDVSMLRAAGVGVAMANAHPDVKAAADRLTDSCDEDGVAKVIEQLL